MKVFRLSVLPLRTVLVALTLSALALPPFVGAADFSLNPARDFGAIRRIDPRDYSGLAVVREDGSGLSSSTAAAFRAALEVFSKAEVNASDALNVRLDGSRVMTGTLKFSGNYGILQSTSDGADNQSLSLCGGGGSNADRGPLIGLYGNEYTTIGGQARYYAGNVSTGDHIFYTGAGTERMRLTYSGNLGIGTAAPAVPLDIRADNVDCGGQIRLQASDYAQISFYDSAHPELNTTNMIGSIYAQIPTKKMVLQSLQSSIIFNTPTGKGVLIGTTTDDGTNKLQVTGNAKITGTIESTGAAKVGGDLTVTGASTNFRNAIKAVDGAGSGLDADTVPNATPASAGAAGTAGMIRYDANYIYICVAANTWKRAAISTW